MGYQFTVADLGKSVRPKQCTSESTGTYPCKIIEKNQIVKIVDLVKGPGIFYLRFDVSSNWFKADDF